MANIPWPVDLELRPAETLIRHDPVYANLMIEGRHYWGRSHMILTSRRIVFDPPPKGRHHWRRKLAWFWPIRTNSLARLGKYIQLRPIEAVLEIDLRQIARFKTWRPYLSGSPVVVLEGDIDVASFERLKTWDLYPASWFDDDYFDTKEKRLEHFEAVQGAWKAVMQLQRSSPPL